jgi:predicted Zn finger-like uncharacterized protein
MIVVCSACSARFRVADEKVGPRGARIRCTRCGQTFAVSPAPPPSPTPDPVAPPEPPATASEATGTGGWPTGVLEVPGTPAADTGTPLAVSLEGDPFATFAGAAAGSGFLGSRSVTNLSDLERTGAAPIAVPDPVEPGSFREGGLSLEEGTKAAAPTRDGSPRWDEPDATSAVAVGPDGFQEVDLAAGAAPPDPSFDPLDPEPTPAAPAQRLPPREATPQVVSLGAAPAPPGPPPGRSPAPAQPRAPRFRALAMNVLSLAALLIVTVGILVWWRGEGIGSILRWPGSARQRDVEVSQVSSGEYEGARGHPVLFVRGVVRATRAPVEGPVAVRVELVRAGATLGAATGAAGAVPSPEQLAGIASAEDLARMVAALLPTAPARLEPGKDLPFLVVLPRPEGDIGAIRFRVEPVLAPGR